MFVPLSCFFFFFEKEYNDNCTSLLTSSCFSLKDFCEKLNGMLGFLTDTKSLKNIFGKTL